MPSPIELLTDRGERQPGFLSNKWNTMMSAASGFLMACTINFGFRRPIFSGIQQHLFLTALGGGGGYYFDKKRDAYLAERDATLRNYIELHPGDFPTRERKKFADVLDIWIPVR